MNFNTTGDFLTFEEFCNLKPEDIVWFDWTKRKLLSYPILSSDGDIIIVTHLWEMETSNGTYHQTTEVAQDDYGLYDIWRNGLWLEYDGNNTVWSDL